MQKTICDRCGKPINGPLAIVGLWAGDGVRGCGYPLMNRMPAVTVMNLCLSCRAKVEQEIKGE